MAVNWLMFATKLVAETNFPNFKTDESARRFVETEEGGDELAGQLNRFNYFIKGKMTVKAWSSS